MSIASKPVVPIINQQLGAALDKVRDLKASQVASDLVVAGNVLAPKWDPPGLVHACEVSQRVVDDPVAEDDDKDKAKRRLTELGIRRDRWRKAVQDKIGTPEEPDAIRAVAYEHATTLVVNKGEAVSGALQALGIGVRVNLRSMRVQYLMPGGRWFDWEDRDDYREDALRMFISQHFKHCSNNPASNPTYPVGTKKNMEWEFAINALAAQRMEDPFLKWLTEELPQWDGTPRLNTWLGIFGCDVQDKFVQWAGRWVFLGPVQRTFDPGSKLDESAVLIGRQGMGKSSAARQTLPPEMQHEWFDDSINMTYSAKQKVEALEGRVIEEFGELSGLNRAQLDSTKTFFSRQDDGAIRKAYARNPIVRKRRCIIVGTTDKPECLPQDTQGNRRFVPIELKHGCNVEQFMAQNRAQLWAEAVAEYAKGERANLPRSLLADQLKRADAYMSVDDLLVNTIQEITQSTAFHTGGEDGTMPTRLKVISDEVNRRHTEDVQVGDNAVVSKETKPNYRYGEKQIAATLKHLGWKKTQQVQMCDPTEGEKPKSYRSFWWLPPGFNINEMPPYYMHLEKWPDGMTTRAMGFEED